MTDSKPSAYCTARDIAAAVLSGQSSAVDQVGFHLNRITNLNPALNCFTHIDAEGALRKAEALDKRVAAGEQTGPLSGVPFAVKNLFDIKGLKTLAGSKINQANPAANDNALLIERMENAGAILVGALAMGEYAYDFTGENEHYGACKNPWDTSRMSGGSSSGSGASVAAGLVPLSLGSDTNGSIRVPASLCGIYGLKPTYGRLPRAGTFPFCDSLDHLGPMARTVTDLCLSFNALQQETELDSSRASADPAYAGKPALDALSRLNQQAPSFRFARAVATLTAQTFQRRVPP